VFPYFVAEGDQDAPYLVFHETSREGWLLIGLDSGGRIASRSRWGGDGRERPLVRRSGGAMRLEWPQVAVAPGSGGF